MATSTTSTTASKSSSITLRTDYYLQSFYKDNRTARKSSGRKELSRTELAYEDARALKRAVKKLESFKYEDTDNEQAIKSAVDAFTKVFNNALSTCDDKTMSKDMQRYARKMKQLAKDYKDELYSAGITVKEDGTMSVNEDRLKKGTIATLKKVFSKSETKLLGDTYTASKNIKRSAYDELYAQLTGNGTQLNITL